MPIQLIAHIDGSCEPVNPGGTATYAVIVKDTRGKVIWQTAEVLGSGRDMSNNVAEYVALTTVLFWFKDQPDTTTLLIKSDSQLVVQQMNGKWRANAGLYLPYYNQARALLFNLPAGSIQFEWIPKEMNFEADRLCRSVY